VIGEFDGFIYSIQEGGRYAVLYPDPATYRLVMIRQFLLGYGY